MVRGILTGMRVAHVVQQQADSEEQSQRANISSAAMSFLLSADRTFLLVRRIRPEWRQGIPDGAHHIGVDANIVHITMEVNMRTRSSNVPLGLIVVMALSSGCAADQLQRFRDTIEVALDTTHRTLDIMERGAKTVQCMKDNTCPAQEE